jgi:epoxyqueuosine reductase
MTTTTNLTIEQSIKSQALELGFDLVGITRLGPVESAPIFEDWLARGFAGEMDYLARGAEKRRDASAPFPPARSAIVVALDYGGREPSGPVARYARGDDYHELMVDRLDELHRAIEAELGYEISGKAYVDTGPILERDLARKAGLGWFGKSTMLINPKIGSFFFIGSLVIDLELEADAPFEHDRCGNCTRCIDACPTGAILEERVLDATKCISYLTIEQRGEIPAELAPMVGENVYGCDICQDVCPWNVSFAQELKEPAFAPRAAIAGKDARTLANDLLAMDDETFRREFRGSPMKRAKRAGLMRNAAVVLKNTLVAVGILLTASRAGAQNSTAPNSAAVQFVQGMMHHHAQAIVMSGLAPTHSTRPDILTATRKIGVSQRDEIAMMARWLIRHGQSVPAVDTAPANTTATLNESMPMPGMSMPSRNADSMHSPMMPGMLTSAQMKQLAGAHGAAFDSLFLKFMIMHHEGALKMVADLFAVPGATDNSEIFQLASDIDADQRAEIVRMESMQHQRPLPKKRSRSYHPMPAHRPPE